MPFSFTPEQREFLKNNIALFEEAPKGLRDYHLDALEFFESIASFRGKDVLELGGSTIPRLVTHDILGANTWVCIDDIGRWIESYRRVRGDHYRTEQFLPLEVAKPGHLDLGYVVFMGDATFLPQWFDRRFDLVISIAGYEHFRDIGGILKECHRVTKHDGIAMADYGPIWSGFAGHHLDKLKDREGKVVSLNHNNPVPPWGHLLLDKSKMLARLSARMEPDVAEKAVLMIYDDPFINRLFSEDYLSLFLQSAFAKFQYRKKSWNRKPEESILKQLEAKFPGRADFTQIGAQVALFKY